MCVSAGDVTPSQSEASHSVCLHFFFAFGFWLGFGEYSVCSLFRLWLLVNFLWAITLDGVSSLVLFVTHNVWLGSSRNCLHGLLLLPPFTCSATILNDH